MISASFQDVGKYLRYPFGTSKPQSLSNFKDFITFETS
jgi:hypothetical protein